MQRVAFNIFAGIVNAKSCFSVLLQVKEMQEVVYSAIQAIRKGKEFLVMLQK